MVKRPDDPKATPRITLRAPTSRAAYDALWRWLLAPEDNHDLQNAVDPPNPTPHGEKHKGEHEH